ncbi:MAG: fibronectin type III domain-containing protein [Deltaproteobacteria bacterium]|nr:fibronectin type III domain-containing protein [Deltaproteobacteria bacterium]
MLLLLTTALISGCGGGGGSTSGGPALPAKTLSWQPPSSYADSTPLNPATDLDSFEIYVNESGVFTDTDKADAALAAYNPGSGQVTTSFNLANLGPYLSMGTQYHVAVRAVAKNGLKSDFSPTAAFSF